MEKEKKIFMAAYNFLVKYKGDRELFLKTAQNDLSYVEEYFNDVFCHDVLTAVIGHLNRIHKVYPKRKSEPVSLEDIEKLF